MGRPPLPIGAWGDISYTTRSGKVAAYARYRDYDGSVRPVLRTGKTKAAARAALLDALADRAQPTLGELTRDTRISALATLYEAELLASTKHSDQTKTTYISKLRTIRRDIGNLRLGEATPGRLDRFVQGVAKTHPSAAALLRAVLKNMFELAVLDGACEQNPIAAVRAVTTTPRQVVAVRAEELGEIRPLLRAWDTQTVNGHPRNGDLTDATDMYLATGARTGEVLALYWPSLLLDADPYEVVIDKTVIKNLQGKIVIQPYTKTKRIRQLELPPAVGAMLLRRRVNAESDLVFPGATGGVRSTASLRTSWHAALKGSKFEGLQLGLYRKAVATHVAERLGIEAARDQLGHSGLSALKHYVEQSKRGPQAAAVIDELFSQFAD